VADRQKTASAFKVERHLTGKSIRFSFRSTDGEVVEATLSRDLAELMLEELEEVIAETRPTPMALDEIAVGEPIWMTGYRVLSSDTGKTLNLYVRSDQTTRSLPIALSEEFVRDLVDALQET
jgi:hypothetical protein